jgi:hypothetical protein
MVISLRVLPLMNQYAFLTPWVRVTDMSDKNTGHIMIAKRNPARIPLIIAESIRQFY